MIFSVCTCQPKFCSFPPYPETEECLEEVVGGDQALDVVRLPVLHEPGAPYPDDVVVESAQTHIGPHAGHEEPVIHPENKISCLLESIQSFIVEGVIVNLPTASFWKRDAL